MSGDRAKVDDTILRYADSRSAEEISQMLGGLLSATKVAERRNFLLKSRNPLDEAQQMELMDYRLRSLLAEMESGFQDLDSQKARLPVIKELYARLDKRKQATDDQLSRLYANQAQIMFDAIRLAFAVVVEELAIDQAIANDALAKALPQAVHVISERNAGEEIEA